MSTTGRSEKDAAAASDVAGRLREAGFVRLVGAATGDALAASGVLAQVLDARDRPFQVSIAALPVDADRATDADLTVAVGRADASADCSLPGTDHSASAAAFDAARELAADGTTVDADTADADTADADLVALALAGAVADGRVPTGALAEAAAAAGIEREAGVAVPTADLADGLAHSTLVHAPFSGDTEAATALVESLGLAVDTDPTALDDEARERVASLVALRTVGPDAVPPRGGDAVERALRPHTGGPFGTVEGYADVLDAVARERPGTGVALALGHDVRSDALVAWRDHAGRAHEAVRAATTGRYDGLYVARAESAAAPVATLARLVHAYRSPEPCTLAVTDGAAAAVADDGQDLSTPLAAATDAADGDGEVRSVSGDGTGPVGFARFDADTAAFITAFREAR